MEGETIAEYAHAGTSPIQTLNIGPWSGLSCSVDPSTGNLAVVEEYNGERVAVFPDLESAPQTYRPQTFDAFNCGYDVEGNLFVDGDSESAIAELPKGASSLETLTFGTELPGLPYEVQWDGSFVTIEVSIRRTIAIYQLQVSSSQVAVVGTTLLDGDIYHPTKTWVQNNTVILPFGSHAGRIGFFHYPKGGNAFRKIKSMSGGTEPFNGSTVSLAPH